MSVTVGVSYAAIATREKLRGGIGLTKVRRYWPGKAPVWAEEPEEEDHENKVDVFDRGFHKHDDDLGFARKDDPRLRCIAQTRSENREKIRSDHRRVIHEPEIISAEVEKEESRNQETRDEKEDEDALEERRRRIREKNPKRTREEADLLPVEEEELQDEEEEESEYETDSEYEIVGITMLKPMFVPKFERDTVTERERLEAEEEALEESAKRKLEMRKTETKQIIVEEVRKYEEMRKNMVLGEANIRDVETDDEIDEAEEYEAWKTREIARIKREKDAKEAMLREKEEIDNLKNMTEEEGKNPNPKPSTTQQKKKWKFMQRYYHKGAFFQEDDIFLRDFSAPTGEDKLDKSKLRKILQVKKFGHSGRTKWTHLLNEDTTGKGNQWTLIYPLCEKYKKRMVGMDALIAKPKGSKKMKTWEY